MFLSISLLQIPFRWSPERRRLEGHGRCGWAVPPWRLLRMNCWICLDRLSEIFTPWKTNMDPENWWFGRGISFQLCGCLVSMLVFRGVSEKCYSPCLCQIVFLCLTTLASAKASLAWSILAIHMTSGWQSTATEWTLSQCLELWHAERKRHLESGCSKWLVAWAPRYFFVGYLGFLLSVRDPENAWQWEMMRSTLTALMKPSHETGFPVDGKDPCLDLYSTCSFPRFKEDQTTIQPVPLISSRFEQRYKPTHNTSNFQGSKCITCLRVLIS